jgi:hypothetical protein
MYVPVSEDNGTFRAKYSKDPTGWSDWKSGDVATKINKQKDLQRKVYLSRYAAPVEIVPDSEVAQAYKEYLDGTDVTIPDNVVSPNLLNELKKAGVPITESGKVKYSVSADSEGNQLSKEQSEYFKDSKVRDENGNLKVMYHGSPNAGFTVFKSGTYFTEHKWYADLYQNQGASSLGYKKTANNPDTYAVYLDIKKPFDTRNKTERDIFYNELCEIPYLYVIPSQANYFLCEVIDKYTSAELTQKLIEHDIIISNCGLKKNMNGKNLIRLAVRGREDNMKLIKVLKSL